MRKAIVHGAWLVAVAASVAGCGPAASTSSSGSSTPSSSATVQPSGAGTAASNPSAAPTNIPTGGQYPTGTASATALSAADTGPLGLLPIPSTANPWTTNTDALLGLDAYIKQFYDSGSQASEKSLYTQRGFVSGAFEGWFNADGSQQTISIARFATATGASYAFSDLSGSLQQNPAPDKEFTDSADGAVGSADPTLDSEGNTYIDITAHVGDYLVDVHEFSAKTPDTSAAKDLLLEQVKALKSHS